MSDELEQLVTAVRASSKYRHVCRDFVAALGAQELAKRRGLKDAIKATKNKLHQVGGAYLDHTPDYAAWLRELRAAAQPGSVEALRPLCLRMMAGHASTRERLPILPEFFAATLAGLAPIRRVVDLACGLNPLAIPWMPLAPGAEYYACDIYEDMLSFLGDFMSLCGLQGRTEACDVLAPNTCTFEQPAGVAFLLKAIPCLEQVDKAAGLRLLDRVAAEHVLVSFPIASLGGHGKSMAANYEAHFRDMLAGRPWRVQPFRFASELAFLVSK
jgi:16S rRNA (guanine(1405)-N(7))-methyltransferase